MYKILTHLHTQSPSVHRYHMVQNDKGEWVDYQSDNLDDVEAVAIELLKDVGYCDLTVVEEHPFYVDLYYQEDPDFTGEEEKEEALTMLQYLGWDDLRISDQKPFGIDIIWGVKPEMEKPKYNIDITTNLGTVTPEKIEDAIEGSSWSFVVDFGQEVETFHLVINGEEQKEGNPDWIQYTKLSANEHRFVLNGITQDYTIEVIAD